MWGWNAFSTARLGGSRALFAGPENADALHRRTPINRQHKPPVSELAIRLFMKMQRCRNCDRWWDLHTELRREVGAKLWKWPCIEDPHAGNPEKPGTYNYERWKPDEKARARWRALEQGARELRRREREVRRAAKAIPEPEPA